MPTTFPSPLNNIKSTLAAAHAVGGTSITLASGTGATISTALDALGLPTISASAPLRFTLAATTAYNAYGILATPSLSAVYEATGLAGDTLSGVTVEEGSTDQAFAVGSVFAVDLTAGTVATIQSAINALETGTPSGTATYIVQSSANAPANAQVLATLGAGVLKTDASGVVSRATAGTDYLAPNSSGAALTGLTAAQIGSVPGGVLKGSGGALTPATVDTDYLGPSSPVAATNLTGTVAATKGGTGASTASGARANLQTTGPAVRSAGVGSVQISPAGRVVIAPGLFAGTGSTPPAKSHNAFPALTMTATGRLLVMYRNGVAHADPNSGPGSSILYRFSDSMGATWTSPVTLYTDATRDVREPVAWRITQGPNAGRIFGGIIVNSSTVRERPYLCYSDDNAATFTTPVLIYDQARWGDSGRQQFTSPPIELADGTLLWACYGWGTPIPSPLTYIASVYRSTDHGLTWTWLSTIEDGAVLNRQPEEPCLALLDDGSILASVRYDDTLTIKFYKSTDNGATWTNPASPIATVNGCGRPSILQMTNAAPGTPGAIVCVTRGDQPTYPGQQTIVYTSRDRGGTWTGPVTMDERTLPDFVYAGLVEVSPGVIGCAYAVEYPSVGAYAETDFIYLTDGNVRDPLGGATHVAVSSSVMIVPTASVPVPSLPVTPAITSGATLAQLETQLNTVIQLLGQGPVASPHPLSLASCFGLWEAANVPTTVNDWSGTMATVSDLTRLDGGTLSGTALAGTWAISGGALKLSVNASKSAFTWDPGKADVTFKVKFTYVSGTPGVVFRAIDGSNLLTVKMTSTFTRLYKRIAGTETQLVSVAPVISGAGDYWCQVTLAGTSISAWVWADGGSQPASATLTYTLTGSDATTFTTPTRHGVGADDTNQAYASVSLALGLTDGDRIGYLPDTSGLLPVPNGSPLNLTQATVSKQPTWVHLAGYFRAKPVLLFSGTGVNLLSATFTAKAQPNAIVGVFYLTATTSQFHLLAGQGADGSGNSQNLSIQSSNILQISAGTGLNAASAVTFPYGPHVFTAIFNGASSSLRIDGQTVASGNANTKAWTQIILGDGTNTSLMYTPGFAGLHGSTTPTDVASIERYFATKYGINLAS